MPVLVGAAVAPSQPVAPPTSAPSPVFTRLFWTGPDGVTWPLMDATAGIHVLDGRRGFDAPPVSLTYDDLPAGGSSLRGGVAQRRALIVPLFVRGHTADQFRDRWRGLVASFASTSLARRGAPPPSGWLTVQRGDGTRRRIACHYTGGIEGDLARMAGLTWNRAVVELSAPDPYWQDVLPEQLLFEHPEGSDYFAPYPTVSAANVLGAQTLWLDGDVETWPTWRITAPWTSVTMANDTIGESFTLTRPAGGGGSLDIVTEPTRSRLVSSAGVDWTEYLDWPGASLWPLVPGENRVRLDLAGSQPGSSVHLTVHQRRLTA